MIVLDASALLALIGQEPGSDVVVAQLDEAVMSTANLAEVLGMAADRGLDVGDQRRLIDALGIRAEPVIADDAVRSAQIRLGDMAAGPTVLSLGDRLCLALALRLDVPVLTADGGWKGRTSGIEVRQIR